MGERHRFDWQRFPEAEKWQLQLLDTRKKASFFLRDLDEQLLRLTSSRLLDWVDHFLITEKEAQIVDFNKMGFREAKPSRLGRVLYHPGAQLPRLVVVKSENSAGVAILVDSIADFQMVHRLHVKIEGSPFSAYRRSLVAQEGGFDLFVVERRGTQTFVPVEDGDAAQNFSWAYEAWASRPRRHGHEDEDMVLTIELAEKLAERLGAHHAAAVVLEVERRYWELRNTAGQVQKSRQDRVGMGWANHDHHTFRSSRKQFHLLVQLFETLGFFCRERFYAGREAGWGAQVMESSEGRFVLFLDVDLAPEELEIDFAHQDLPELDHLNTVGLWCALHGDSILRGGMHHLECQFMFDELAEDLKEFGVGMMKPFSDFSYLKQAFSLGEKWSVDPHQLDKLADAKLISEEERERFLREGAVGSHLENLQRRDGYKGFNQKNVSFIIEATDPRKQRG